jgi:hypothetical protein
MYNKSFKFQLMFSCFQRHQHNQQRE